MTATNKDFLETLAELQEKDPNVLESLGEAVGILAGHFILKRKLKKLGFSTREQYVLLTALSALGVIRLQLVGIRKELRKLNKEAAAKGTRRTLHNGN
jgi:hypothetical protein